MLLGYHDIFSLQTSVPITSPLQKDPMSDSDKLRPHTTPTEPSEGEDESIIDLVEEIEEDTPSDALPPLTLSMPATDGPSDAVGVPAAEFGDLGKLDFDEEEDQPQSDDLPLKPASGESDVSALKDDADWLIEPEEEASSVEGGHSVDPSADTRSESGDVHAAAPETEAVLEALIPPPAETDSGSEEDDIELIEIEDDEDEEIVWFDDLDLGQAPPVAELTPEAEAPVNPLSEADADLFPETSAADVFAANVASGVPATEHTPADLALPTAIAAAAASLTTSPPSSPARPSAPDEPPISESISLSDEQIDAALERIIERRLGSTLESVVLRAVETAVADEIRRLKTLLIEDGSSDRTP
jgi:hypothetical protein